MAYKAKTTTIPITAEVSVFLAPSVCALSPPAVIHLIPPKRIIKIKRSPAITMADEIKAVRSLWVKSTPFTVVPDKLVESAGLFICARTIENNCIILRS